MSTAKRLTKVFNNSKELLFNDKSKIVLISDCHRGDNSWTDDFANNQNLLFTALNHYYKSNFTYIEVGDGDELWKNKEFSLIRNTYSNIFWLLKKFHEENRYYVIWGNHDIEKSNASFVKNHYNRFFDLRTKMHRSLFEDLLPQEGIILKHEITGKKIFVVHGHQGDLINDKFWKLGRFLVRYFWKNLEVVGVKDPTSPARNYTKADKLEKKIINWVKENHQMLIAGHTHRPMFPSENEPQYFNDGSCVHPRCITGIEIVDNNITLIKWSIKTNENGFLYVGRDIIAGPTQIL